MSNIPITVSLRAFDGGRFYRNRYVRCVSVTPPLIPRWWNDRVDQDSYRAIGAVCQRLIGAGTERLVNRATRTQMAEYATDYRFEDGDQITLPLFGLTATQFFYRQCRSLQLLAFKRGRSGRWFCEAEQYPLYRIPTRQAKRYFVGKISKEWSALFDPLPQQPPPDYSAVDLGPDRKPPVWVCNLCGRTAPWSEWDWRDEWDRRVIEPRYGALFEHISHCPDCGAKARSGMFEQIEDALKSKPEAFRPTRRMQDDLFFTL